jgi:hypothetical protein
MVKKTQVALLTAFLKDKVHITTNLLSAIQLPDGEVVEAPWALEGYLLDHDETFILIGQDDNDALELIAIDKIVAVKQVFMADEIMKDPNKPSVEGMN